jgi:hypothetical protein
MAKFPWLKLRKKTEPELPLEPPIWLGSYSNGELFHEQTPRERRIRQVVLERADEGARRLGIDRREFLASAAGFATTLSVINLASCGSSDGSGLGGAGGGGAAGGAGGRGGGGSGPGGSGPGGSGPGGSGPGGSGGSGTLPDGGPGGSGGAGATDGGGYYDVGTDTLDGAQICSITLDPSKEFIFDVQTHHVNRSNETYQVFLSVLPQGACGKGIPGCYARNEYVAKMFLDSDTTVAVLSGIPAVDNQNPLNNDEIAATRDAVNMLARSQRSVNHAMVLPNYNLSAQLEGMQRVKEQFGVGAWKCYTPWGPQNNAVSTPGGFWLDDEATGIPFIERGRQLGVKVFCCHKGLPLPGFNPNFTSPRDVGVVAKRFPDCHFVIYHSAYQQGGSATEGPYVEGSTQGVNSLITSLKSAGVGPNQNVYGELGTTWRELMARPTEAAHVIGKLLLHLGENNVVWGTDSIWYGSPQPQIQAFLMFQISTQFQQQYGYPALTNEIKRKILGLNSARIYGIDARAVRCGINRGDLALTKQWLDGEFGDRRWSVQRPVMTTRREFLDFVRLHKALNLPG